MLHCRADAAIDRELDAIAGETHKSKSELIREAILAFIGMYRNTKPGKESHDAQRV
ncbi:MAG: ribbon-helix-helix protein, CopG family [Dehalococcoidia bacterium]